METMDVKIYKDSAGELLQDAQALAVTSQMDYNVAAAFEMAAKDLESRIKKHHAPMKQKAHETHKAIVAGENALLHPVVQARKLIKGKMIEWFTGEERKRRVEAAKLAKEAEDKRLAEAQLLEESGQTKKAEEVLSAPAPVAQAMEIEVPTGIHYRDNWKARVVDFSKLIDAWKLANIPALNQKAKESKGQAMIPGVEFYNDRYQVG